MIQGAAKLGDLLVVITNDDNFLLRKKNFVFMTADERAEVISHICGVDKVIIAIDTDQSVCRTLEMVRPDIFANGGDRRDSSDIPEAKICQRIGCEMVFNVGGGKVQSSSDLVNKVR